MRIYIDADACPVTKLAVDIARNAGVPVAIVCDDSHVISIEETEIYTVAKGRDSADLALINMIHSGDCVLTQDYGLAALCLAKHAYVIDQNGHQYTNENIDGLLAMRHIAAVNRRAGGHIKGPSRRTASQDEAFSKAFRELLQTVKHFENERLSE